MSNNNNDVSTPLFDPNPDAKPESYWPLKIGIIAFFIVLVGSFVFAAWEAGNRRKEPIIIKYMDNSGWHTVETTRGMCRIDEKSGVLRYNGTVISQGLYVIEPAAK